jgi:hypothetical protein
MTAEQRPTRGAKEALDKIEQLSPVPEVISQEVIREGKELLMVVAHGVGKRVFDVKQMREVLAEMVTDTSFAGARVDFIEDNKVISNGHANMNAIMGEYASGHAYNVWLVREGESWVVKYNKIPQGGNYR